MTGNLHDILTGEGVRLGTWNQIAAPEIVDLIGLNGFEFSIIDCEHGFFGIETAENLSRAADANGLASLVRVKKNDPIEIMKALDAGIPHVVVPNLSSKQEADHAVAATRFAPHGLRGACPCCRSGGHFIQNWAEYAAEQEARVGVVGLVESEAGYRNIEDICRNTDLTALMFGPFDLSVSMGLEGNWRDLKVVTAVREMIECAMEHGHKVMMPVFSPDAEECRNQIEEYEALGVNVFVIGSDKILVANAFSQWALQLK